MGSNRALAARIALQWVLRVGALAAWFAVGCAPAPQASSAPESSFRADDRTSLARHLEERLDVTVDGDEVELAVDGRERAHRVQVEMSEDVVRDIESPLLVVRADERRELILETDPESAMQVYIRGRDAEGEYRELLPFPETDPAIAYWRTFVIAPEVGWFAGRVDDLGREPPPDDSGDEHTELRDGQLNGVYDPKLIELRIALLPVRPEGGFQDTSYDVRLEVGYDAPTDDCGALDGSCCALFEVLHDGHENSPLSDGLCAPRLYCEDHTCIECPEDLREDDPREIVEQCLEPR